MQMVEIVDQSLVGVAGNSEYSWARKLSQLIMRYPSLCHPSPHS